MSLFSKPKNRPGGRTGWGRAVGKPRGRWYFLTIGVGAMLVLGLMFYIGYEAPNSTPLRGYYYIYANMPTADNLTNHFEVRIGGLLAGQVSGEQIQDGHARLRLQLDSSFKPVRSNSTVEIRLRSAVGVRYLDLIPSTTGTPIPNNGTLAESQARTPIDLDQVLSIFDKDTRTRTQEFLTDLGGGLAGRGEDLGTFIEDGPSFFSSLGNVSTAITSHPGAMGRFVVGADGAADAFNPVRYTAADGFQPEDQALQPFTDEAPAVRSTLDDAPPALNELSTGLPAVRGLLTQVDSLANQAKPFFQAAPSALHQANLLLKDSQPTLRNASKTLSLAQQAVPPTLSLLKTIQPVAPDLTGAFDDLTPALDIMGPRACNIPLGLNVWADSMRYSAPNGNGDAIQFTLFPNPSQISNSSPALNALGNLGPDTRLENPYPGPCVNGDGEGGPPPPTPDQQVTQTNYGPGQIA